MSEIDEFRYDCMRRGIIISEKLTKSPYNNQQIIQVKMDKMDQPYNLNFALDILLDAAIYGTVDYLVSLKNLSATLEQIIFQRHHSNPNACPHTTIVVSEGKKICTGCVAVLGESFNFTLTNN